MVDNINYKVLITTSGIGSRLGELTDYTNKSLVRVGDKPAISLIIDKYPLDTEFVITLGHYGNYVKEFLQIVYPNRLFEFVNVDKYTGPESSLAYSILQAKDKLQSPFIFNACDTLFLTDEVIQQALDCKYNFCVGEKKNDSSQYATILCNSGKIEKIKEKGELNYDFAYAGLCGIVNYELFWNILENIFNSNENHQNLYEGSVINLMLSKVDFSVIESKDWLDIGNVGELEKTKNCFSSFAEVLEKKEETIYFYDDFVVKFFSDSNINKNRVRRAKRLFGLVPKLIQGGENFYKYKKVEGSLFADTVNPAKFVNFLNWAKSNLWIHKEHKKFNFLCQEFYITKTKKRIYSFLKDSESEPSSINQVPVLTALEMLDKIDKDWLCSGVPVQFHGDFILDNILETSNGFCLLDWRQDFAGNLEIGDIYYDLAKLNHNLIVSHELVNKKLFNSDQNNCYILCNSKLIKCKEILKQFIINEGYDYNKVRVLTSLIWINMAPLHEYPFNKFLFNFGKQSLQEFINEKN